MPQIITEDAVLSGTYSGLGFGDNMVLSADGSLLAVASPQHAYPDAPGTSQGAVYLYDTSDLSEPIAILQPSVVQQDMVGMSVAFESTGTMLIVGAPGTDNAPGTSDGMVYIYDLTGPEPVLATELTAPDDLGQFGQFGWEVNLSADGSTLIVQGLQQGDSDVGDVHVYSMDGTTPTYLFSLAAETPSLDALGFGVTSSISADGQYVVIGAHQEAVSEGGQHSVGAVYIYDISGEEPVQVARITEPAAGPNADFGSSISLSADGTVLVVSADQVTPFITDTVRPGAVYVYDLTDGVPSLRYSFNADDTEAMDAFGTDLMLTADGNTLLVGAPSWDGEIYDPVTLTGLNDGLIYAFDISGDEPILLGAFGESGDPRIPYFGNDIAISPDGSVVVGAQQYASPLTQTVSVFLTEYLTWNRVVGSSGRDTLTGTDGDDAIFGDDGRDVLTGGDGNNWLDGGAGFDRITGGDDADVLIDGEGFDILNGGLGADSFVLAGDGATDVIIGFESGTDQIDLSGWNIEDGDAPVIASSGALQIITYEDERLLLIGGDAIADDFVF